MNNGKDFIRVLIVDDEPLARKKIRRFLDNETGIEIIGECCDGEEAVAAIIKHSPDLVFLDIKMPKLDGIGVLETIGAEQLPLIIFVTAYDQFAIKAFEFHALDYLLKPFNRTRFTTALSRARKSLRTEKREKSSGNLSFHSVLSFLEEMKKKESHLNRLMVKDGEKMVVLDVEEIKWLESDRNYIDIHVISQSKYRIRETLGNLETRLNPDFFVRINRSTIVNTRFIKEMQPLFKKEFVVILKSGEKLILNKNYFPKLEAVLK